MSPRRSWLWTVVCIAALAVFAAHGRAQAQPAEPAPAPPAEAEPESPAPEASASDQPSGAEAAPGPTAAAPEIEEEPPPVSAETKALSRSHFLRGLKLLNEQAWAPALAEFLRSRALYPTRVATNNAAIALRKLERYDEALDMFETLLREFKVQDEVLKKAQQDIAELRALVGTIDISGAEPGAAIVISSVDRGEYPPVNPIRVPAGNHVVRVFKEGFEPFETKVDVAGGQTVSVVAKLGKLKDSGRLRVTEKTGKAVGVVVDNVVVGQTPWIGTLSVGTHMVQLRGTGKLGSQPTAAPVKSQQVTQLSLQAEPLEAQLRIDPTPPGASVWINSVNVGRGAWLGRLKAGPQNIEVKADGFLTDSRQVVLQKGQREMLPIELERDEDAPIWRIPPKWTVDVGGSLLIVPTFGGDVAGDCGEGCGRSVGIGGMALVHGSYELGSGLGFGLELGYLIAGQDVTGREAELLPQGTTTPTMGTADDSLRLQGFMAGATIGYHLGEDVPVVFRLGAGIMQGEVRDARTGSFTAQHGGAFDAYTVVDFPSATYFYLDPGARVGVRFAESFELTGSVQALMLIAISAPTWNPDLELAAGSDGVGSYPDEAVMGDFVISIAPGVNLRYDF